MKVHKYRVLSINDMPAASRRIIDGRVDVAFEAEDEEGWRCMVHISLPVEHAQRLITAVQEETEEGR